MENDRIPDPCFFSGNKQKFKTYFADKKQSDRQYAIPAAFGVYVKYMKEETR